MLAVIITIIILSEHRKMREMFSGCSYWFYCGEREINCDFHKLEILFMVKIKTKMWTLTF